MNFVYKINHIRQRHAMSRFEHGMTFLIYATNENGPRWTLDLVKTSPGSVQVKPMRYQ